MKPFEEADRYIYDLNKSSVVIDIGGHMGDFSAEVSAKYDCEIWIFEPLRVYFDKLMERFGPNNAKILMFNSAVGAKNGSEIYSVKGCMSGAFADGDQKEAVKVISIIDVVRAVKDRKIDLLKINAEGAEFEILEAILNNGLSRCFRNIQVQPHSVVPRFQERWELINTRLLASFDLAYHADWCWSGYKLRE